MRTRLLIVSTILAVLGLWSCGSDKGSSPTVDTTAPAAIDDLHILSKTASSFTIAWTAPGDDGGTGTANAYDIRYSTSAITSSSWDDATQATDEPTPKAAGASGERARRGFIVFRDNCVGCHSVNLVGGDLAPELNVPKSVTEYWRPDDIRALIRDASTYRARSKMPPFPQLTGVELDDLLHYFTVMTHQKICDARKPCPK